LALKVNKVFLTVIKVAVSSVLLYLVLTKTGITRVLVTLSDMSLPAFLLAIFLYVGAQLICVIRWKLLLPQGVGMRKLFSLYMIGSFFNTLLPGIIGGDAVKGFYLYKTTGNGGLAFASIFMDRYLGLVVLIALCAIAFPFGYRYLQGSRIEWLLPGIVIAFIAGSLLFFGLRLGRKIKFVEEFHSYFHTYRNQKRVIGKALILSVFVQISGFLSVYILALGMGQHIPFLAISVYLPLIILFSMLPLSISGLGVREGAFVVFFGLVGVKPETATALSLSWFISIAAGSLIGLVEYVRFRREEKDGEVF
jgi:uncharacterized membrane protein YbhN (UPF0104 family)